MPLPSPASRSLAHTRELRFDGYQRDDGLWDIEGHLIDSKPFDWTLASGTRVAGTPIHEMRIRLTIDNDFVIRDVAAASDGRPYPGYCENIAPAYAVLVGLKLGRGFRKAVQQALGGIQGCTHLTEMLGQFSTVAFQTFAGNRRDNDSGDTQPAQLDHCHALALGSEAVRKYYPRWYQAARSGS